MPATAVAPATATKTCGPGDSRVRLPREQAEHMAGLLKALSDPTRLQILSLIAGSPAGEACVCDLTALFDMTQPAISHHMRILVNAGMLHRDKRGSWAWYSLIPTALEPIRHLLPGPAFLTVTATGCADPQP